MRWTFANFHIFLLFPVLLGLIYCLYRYFLWKKRAKNRFANPEFQDKILGKRKSYFVFLTIGYSLAFSFLILAMADLIDIDGKEKTKQNSQNFVFLLDISSSMNVEDVEKNRLTQAKNIILKILPDLEGNRVQILVFAKEAKVALPLTSDLLAAKNMISAIQTTVIEEQGTDFRKAIDLILLTNTDHRSQHVIMISDGENHQKNYQLAIEKAKKHKIKITTIGVGTEEGAPIPEYFSDNFLGYKLSSYGETIISRREKKSLEEIANNTGGIYIDGNDVQAATAAIYKSWEDAGETWADGYSENTKHYYQYFLLISFLLFVIIILTNPKRDFNI